MSRFVNKNGILGKARSFVSSLPFFTTEEVQDPSGLTKILHGIAKRLAAIEAKIGPDFVEIEKEVGTNSDETFNHGLGCPVRWYVVDWVHTTGTGHPTFHRVSESADNKVLVLHSHAAGKVVLRIEPSQYGLTE